jgi:hypothetical protein
LGRKKAEKWLDLCRAAAILQSIRFKIPPVAARGLGKTKFRTRRVMRILLQHVRTGLYLRGPGNWTANPFDALDFQHSQRAIDFACEHSLSGLQIAVRFIDAQFDEVVPMPLPETHAQRLSA